ncbi:MAG: adenosylcobinamide-phosphate synthase CbiB [Saccharofermentanales bacterium]
MRIAIIILCAYVLDLIFGDPNWLPHPVCLIGKIISEGEKRFRRWVGNEFAGGVLLTITVLLISFSIPFVILYIAYSVNRIFGMIVETYFCYQIFAAKSLKTESMKVYAQLADCDLPLARKFLSYIVGRDTQELGAEGIQKATIETVAENTTDGVIAPLIFMTIGGAPLGFLYKAVNTLDSMIGYKNAKYFDFGRFAARLDDFANFIPARISAMLMIAGSFILRLDAKNAFRIYLRDRKKHKSPNSAQTESVCAGALNIQLAGDASYFGVLVEKPTIGDKNREINTDDIKAANRLMYATAAIGAAICVIIRVIVFLFLSGTY